MCVPLSVCVCVFGARHVYSLAGANNVGIDPKPNPKTKPAPQRASASARAVKLSWRAVNLPPGQGLKHLHILLKDIERFQYLDRSTNTHTADTQPHTRTAYCDLLMFAKALRQRVTPSTTTMSWGGLTSIGSK